MHLPNLGSATTIIVITEFALTLLVTVIASIAIQLRAHRKLYATSYLDFSEIAWSVRKILSPRFLITRPYLFFLRFVRVVAPCLLLLAFVFIGDSIQETLDFNSSEEKSVRVHGQVSY